MTLDVGSRLGHSPIAEPPHLAASPPDILTCMAEWQRVWSDQTFMTTAFKPSWFSILAMMRMGCPPASAMIRRASRTASAQRTNDTARKSMSCSAAKRMSATSWSEIDGRLIRTPGRLMCFRDPRTPPSSTRQRRCALAYFQYLQVDQSVVERDPTTRSSTDAPCPW